jgi:hypothetical protein
MLSVWTAIHVLLRLVSLASPYGRVLLLNNRCRANNRNDVSAVVKKCYYGDWFLLTQVAGMALSSCADQAYFQTKNTDLGKFWRVLQ